MFRLNRVSASVIGVIVLLIVVGFFATRSNGQTSETVTIVPSQSPTANMTAVVNTAVADRFGATETQQAGSTQTAAAKATEFTGMFNVALTASATRFTETPAATDTPTPSLTYTPSNTPTFTATSTLSNEEEIATGVAEGVQNLVRATEHVETVVAQAIADLPSKTPTPMPSSTPMPTETPMPSNTPSATPSPTTTATATPQNLTTGSLIIREQGQLDTSYSIFVHDDSVPVDSSTVTFNMTAVGESRIEVTVTVNCAAHTVSMRWNNGEWSTASATCTRQARGNTQRTSLDFSYNFSFSVDGKQYLFSLL